MIKLFVADMDGTLLNPQHLISNATITAFQELRASGIEFMIATGRDYENAHSICTAKGLVCDMITLNGAALYDTKGHLIYQHTLHTDLLDELIHCFDSLQVDYSVKTPHAFYVSNCDKYKLRIRQFLAGHHTSHADMTTAQFVAHLDKLSPVSALTPEDYAQVLKIKVRSENKDILNKIKYHFANHPLIDITSSNYDNLEITHIYAQKGFLIQEYARKKATTMDEVAAIGDSLNDRSMLKMAKYSFAMANASDEVK